VPTFEGVKDALLAAMQANLHLAELIVFTLGFAESIAFVSLLVPSTALFLALGGAHGAAGGDFLTVWAAGAAGATLGDIASYVLGRTLKNDVDRVWPVSRMPGLIPRARAFFARWGGLSLVLSKWFGPLRPFIPIAAGTAEMPWPLFALASAASSVIWAGLTLAPGYGVLWLLQ
jgi:membrane protein DedA with SNARE-associated domain